MNWEWKWWERPIGTDDADTRIRFNDVVFGFVISKLFYEFSAELSKPYTWIVLIHLLLALVVTLGSYIGYRKSLKRSKYTLEFFNLPLLQFLLDLGMIYLYYQLSISPDFTVTTRGDVNSSLDAGLVALIFLLYSVWDGVSFWMAKTRYDKITFSVPRTRVTIVFSILLVLWWAVVNRFGSFHHNSILVDVVLIGLAIAYRWAKDGYRQVPSSGGQAAIQSGQVATVSGQTVTVTISAQAQ